MILSGKVAEKEKRKRKRRETFLFTSRAGISFFVQKDIFGLIIRLKGD